MKISALFLAISFLCFCASEALACICSPKGTKGATTKFERQYVEEAISKASAVFSGEVTKIVTTTAPNGKRVLMAEVHFRVFKSWKGDVTHEMIVYTLPPLCGFPFQVGKRYLVYAGGEKSLIAISCSRTDLLKDSKNDIKYLGGALTDFVSKKPRKGDKAGN